jgi:hypothetical protein
MELWEQILGYAFGTGLVIVGILQSSRIMSTSMPAAFYYVFGIVSILMAAFEWEGILR